MTHALDGARVLVTGAGGFIGSHLVEELVELGAEVRAFTRYTSRGDVGALRWLPADVRDGLEVVSGDLRDPFAVEQAVQGCDTVFHLGALIAIPYSYRHPREVVETNVLGTLNVLEAARRQGTRRLVQISTSEVYGTARSVPIDEAHPLQGQSPYSASKIGADKLAESYFRSFDVPVVTVRPFNTYGPRQSARAVIPTIISQALAGRDVALGSLTPTRDLTFVQDTALGMIAAATAGEDVLGVEINLGNQREISVGDLAAKIISIVGNDVELIGDAQRLRPSKSEVQRLLASTQRAHELLGWRPKTTLDVGLEHTVEWVAQHLDAFRPGHYEV